jgi:hypothetical protein
LYNIEKKHVTLGRHTYSSKRKKQIFQKIRLSFVLCRQGHWEVVECLMKEVAGSMDHLDSEDRTPLSWAAIGTNPHSSTGNCVPTSKIYGVDFSLIPSSYASI